MRDHHQSYAARLCNALQSNPRLRQPEPVARCVDVVAQGAAGAPEAAVIAHLEQEELLCASVYRRPEGAFLALLVRTGQIDGSGTPLVDRLGNALATCRFAPVYASGPHDSFSTTITFEAAIADLADMLERLDPARAFRPGGLPSAEADLRCLIAYEDRKTSGKRPLAIG